MSKSFEDFDFSVFWDDCDYARNEYVEPAPNDIELAFVEKQLGFQLPSSYVDLCRNQNGGIPRRTCFRTASPTSWAEDHVAITGIKAIGRKKIWSLCGSLGSQQAIDEWEYPPIGIYFGDCPSAGHDMICLDYSECGPKGEPRVVHVDQEYDYAVTFLAPNFEAFVRGLELDDAFPMDEFDTSQVVSAWIDEDFLQQQALAGNVTRSDGRTKKPWWRFW